MDVKKWAPWNWLKKEEKAAGKTVPSYRNVAKERGYELTSPVHQFHREIDRLFEQAFRGFGLDLPVSRNLGNGFLKPQLDLSATEGEYAISVEIPGIEEKDVTLEIVNDTLTIRGTKKQKTEERDKNDYRIERTYSSFQRILSLPEDVDQSAVKATFKKGVLTVTMPRKALPKSAVRQIEVQSA